MSKRLKVTADMTNPSMVYDVVATIRQYPARNYTEIARILDEPDITTYYALRYAEEMGYIHGAHGYYNKGRGGSRLWYFDKLAPYPYEYMEGKRHAYKVKRGIIGKTQFMIGGQYGNGQSWVNPVEMIGPKKVMTGYGEKEIRYKTPEPSRWYGPRVDYKTVALFDNLEDAQRWIRRDKKRLEGAVNVFYYHVRVLIPSGLICPRQGVE